SITQVNTKVLGDAPAMAMGNLFVTTSQALSNAAHNATNNQQQSYVTMQASTAQAVATLLTVDTASTGMATHKIY
ncbi:RebB family R body protein, partial [Serratia marcescens]